MAFERLIGEKEIPVRMRWNTHRAVAAPSLAHHREVEIHLIKRGEGEYFIRDRHVPFQKNSLLYIPSRCTHRMVPGGAWVEKGTLMFLSSRFGSRSAALRLPRSFPFHLALSEHEATDMEIIFRALSSECEGRKPRGDAVLAVLLEYLVLLLRRAALQAVETPPPQPVVTQGIAFIERNFARPLTLATLSARQGYSPYYLTRLFSRHTGLSVKQFVLQRRIAEAKRVLLEEPGITVDAVARQVGFSDFALFNRSFKKLTGQTPTLYRRSAHL